MEALDDHAWRRLARAIQRGTCILLLGPDAATDPADPAGVPLGSRLAATLAADLATDGAAPLPDPGDFPSVAQAFENRQGRDALELAVEDFCAPYLARTTPLHDDLAALPFPLYINTAPDPALANALTQAGRAPHTDHYDYQRGRDFALPEPTPEHPWVYDLYGTLSEPRSLVLTERDLLDYLVNVVKGTPRLPAALVARLRDPATSLLYLGFGFRRWYLRILLHVLRAFGPPRNPPLALEDAAFYADPGRPLTVGFYQEAHRIRFHRGTGREFAAELRRRYQAIAAQPAAPAAPEPPAEAPVCFLSYVTEDHDAVRALAERLRGAGLRVWLDRQDLRGGDRWALAIPQVIGHQADYLLVLQTPRLLARVESYVHLEIEEARRRQARFAPGLRFLIPVLFAPGERLPGLLDLHTVDLTAEDGFAALTAAIREDWARRRALGAAPAETAP